MTSENPISIVEIQKSQKGEFLLEDIYTGVNLGGEWNSNAAKMESIVNPLLDLFKSQADHLFVLSWEGTKTPFGARINDKEIGAMRHGDVVSKEGEVIGWYERLIESGGENQQKHQILVYTKPVKQ